MKAYVDFLASVEPDSRYFAAQAIAGAVRDELAEALPHEISSVEASIIHHGLTALQL